MQMKNKFTRYTLPGSRDVTIGTIKKSRRRDGGEQATDQMIADSQRQEMAADRGFADQDEIIRGYRAVEDTQTGQQADVNLEDAHAIVDKLNEGDPGRFIEIPLRDELDPF